MFFFATSKNCEPPYDLVIQEVVVSHHLRRWDLLFPWDYRRAMRAEGGGCMTAVCPNLFLGGKTS